MENKKFVRISALIAGLLFFSGWMVAFSEPIFFFGQKKAYFNLWCFLLGLIFGLIGIIFFIYLLYSQRRRKKIKNYFRTRKTEAKTPQVRNRTTE
ncbi:chloride channel protein [Patescibacteria group bacterium]|nr:chloride channel protein [Patescibacteria group bacterium]